MVTFLLLLEIHTYEKKRCINNPSHTHTRKQRFENTHSRIQGKSSKVENFAYQECKHKENHLTPVKFESKKQAKKMIARQEGLDGKFPSNNRKKPRLTN